MPYNSEIKKPPGDKGKNLFDLTEILAVIWRRKWLIILPLILVSGVALVGSYMITPEYESAVIVYLGQSLRLSTQLQRLLGDAGQGYRGQDLRYELRSIQNEIKSSPYISQLVTSLKLDKDPRLEKAARKIQASQPNLSLDQIKFDILLNSLREKIAISYAGRDQIGIIVQSTDPFKARDMAQKLAEIFISEKMKQELGSVRISQNFSYEQLAKYENELQQKIDERTRLEREFTRIQLDEAVASDENRKAVNSEIDGVRLEIEERKDEERQLLRKLSEIPQSKLVLKESNDSKRLKKEIEKQMGSIANLIIEYSWSAPEILNYKVRLFSLIGELEDENKALVGMQFGDYDDGTKATLAQLFNVRDELDILYSRVNTLRLALDDLNEKVNLIPEYQARIDQLDREINAARELRDTFKELQEGSQISQALLRESEYKVIEPAKVPLAPFKPQKKKIVILGFLLGLAIGGAAIILVEVLDKSFRTVEDVEETLGLPVIGVIPQIDSLKKLKVKR